MSNFQTPMMQQYEEIKSRYSDCLLFFRMGDFYELFLDDALIGVKILGITLTSKIVSKNKRIPMAGVPYHAVEGYITKLVKAGQKVAICEQLSPPNKSGLVERDVIRIITPGTLLSENALENKQNNYIVSLCIDSENENLSISMADISTGFFAVIDKSYTNLQTTILEEFAKICPTECILSNIDYNNPDLLKILKLQSGLNVFNYKNYDELSENATIILKKHFKIATLAAFSLSDKKLARQSCAVLLGYLQDTQKSKLTHIKKIEYLSVEDSVSLDRSTMINLELFSTIREHDTNGTLLNVLDQTETAMGGRLIREWLIKPLKDKSKIEERFDSVDELQSSKKDFRKILKEIPDIERVLSRLTLGLGNARDLVNLKNALQSLLVIKSELKFSKAKLLKNLEKSISVEIKFLIELIEKNIVPEPPIDTKIGGMIASGMNSQVDELRKIIGNSKEWIKELEITEKERTGISSLKVRFNKVFGFYIEISKSYVASVPSHYLRKQTLVNGERFITEALKEKEELILTAEDKLTQLEFELFTEICSQLVEKTTIIQDAALSIATLDCLVNFAYLSKTNRYIRPKLLLSGEIQIKNGRHPVVEKLLTDTQFVPNGVDLDNISQTLLLITGPNMAGKSVYIRQVALIVLMAQIGCFVPAERALISIVDRIFVRSGASDVITSGMSTFMVEMVETAYILNNATSNSLIVMDEIGRGTSTYDGISIAWAIAEYLVTHLKKSPKILFATHYHELQQLEVEYPKKIRNYSMAIAENDGNPVFLYSISKGPASHSFGVAVARLAGVPDEVIEAAKQKLVLLEGANPQEVSLRGATRRGNLDLNQDRDVIARDDKRQIIDDQVIFEHLLFKELDGVDIASMTPLDALNKLAELKDKAKIISRASQHRLKIAD